MPDYVGAIDQGTTSTRFIVFSRSGQIVATAQKEHAQIYPQPGWVEHSPQEIWARTQEVIAEAMQSKGLTANDLAAVGITNQRETTVVWNRKTGQPVYNAIVWQDTRVGSYVDELAKTGGQDRFRAKTGLPLATYFSGLKIRWILENVPGARALAEAGEVLFGNIDTFLLWNLTGGPNGGIHVTDVTNASRTQLMNLETLEWDAEILAAVRHPAGHAAAYCLQQRGVRDGGGGARWRAFRWRETWATSRRRWWGKPASSRDRRRTPTARAASCCSTPTLSRCSRSLGC